MTPITTIRPGDKTSEKEMSLPYYCCSGGCHDVIDGIITSVGNSYDVSVLKMKRTENRINTKKAGRKRELPGRVLTTITLAVGAVERKAATSTEKTQSNATNKWRKKYKNSKTTRTPPPPQHHHHHPHYQQQQQQQQQLSGKVRLSEPPEYNLNLTHHDNFPSRSRIPTQTTQYQKDPRTRWHPNTTPEGSRRRTSPLPTCSEEPLFSDL